MIYRWLTTLSMNPEFSGASYECYFLIKARNFFYFFIAFKFNHPSSLFIRSFMWFNYFLKTSKLFFFVIFVFQSGIFERKYVKKIHWVIVKSWCFCLWSLSYNIALLWQSRKMKESAKYLVIAIFFRYTSELYSVKKITGMQR